jgi:crotonobetainyl-CoA:carnitine CoA-transferase CaiB-like acyl-CoA transferase
METALKGIRVLDLTQYLAGPYGSMVLGDLGADVIKIEPVGMPHEVRRIGPLEEADEHSVCYLGINRNKKAIALDLKKQEGREVFYDLVRVSDVVFDNFRPGILERLAIDYVTLKKINPKIISASSTAYGTTGPWKDRPAYDAVLQAVTGMTSLNGEPDGPPMITGTCVADISSGISSAHGILAALYAREKTGVGQKVEVSMLESCLSLLVFDSAGYLVKGVLPEPRGRNNMVVAPYGMYRAGDGYIMIAAHRSFEKLCEALDCMELLDDPRFRTMKDRCENAKILNAAIEDHVRTKSIAEWEAIFESADIPFSPVNTMDKTFSHPQVLERDIVAEFDFVLGGKVKTVGNPIKMSDTPPDVRKTFTSPPMPAQHSREVMSEVLGYSSDKIDGLIAEGVTEQWIPK